MQDQSLALLSRLRIWHCCELWCRLQIQLGSGTAVAVAAATVPIQPLAWEPPCAMGMALKRPKKKKKKKKLKYSDSNKSQKSITSGKGRNSYDLNGKWRCFSIYYTFITKNLRKYN